jgi:hypothetical protein
MKRNQMLKDILKTAVFGIIEVTMKIKKYSILVFVVAAVSFGFFVHAQMVGVTLPSVPASVTATKVPPSQISVSWAAATESSGTIEGYYVYRNGGQITTTAGTSFIDSGLVSGIYIYTVAAYDASGTVSAQSSPANVTLVADTMPPSTPTSVTITGTTSTNSFYTKTTLTISWGASTDNIGIAGYQVYRDGILIVSSTSALTGTSITDVVTPGTYTYTVAAYDASQNFSNKSVPATVTVGIDTTSPTVPVNISVQQISAAGVNISWATSTDDVGIAGYQIYRNGIQIANASTSPYADKGLSANIPYSYTVAAYDIAGNISAQSSPASVALESTNGPLTPYGLSAVLNGTSTIKLAWAPAVDILLVTGYTVYRDDASIASVTSTNYLDSGLTPGVYTYNVNATDIGGFVSPTSSEMNVIVPVAKLMPEPVITTPIIIASSSSIVSSNAPAGNQTFTEFLYFGLRDQQVENLQSLLAAHGYLSSANATGFFGSITQAALQKFQCDQNIVCTGGAGWGTVGPRTRNILNNFPAQRIAPAVGQGSAAGGQGSAVSSVSALAAEIQALQAELANLENQLQSVSR